MSFPPVSPTDFVTELYIGYYNRAPDSVGLSFWLSAYNSAVAAGANPTTELTTLANSFANSSESTAIYPFLLAPSAANAGSFVTQVYNNILNRAPDAAGLAFWVNQLTTGATTPGALIVTVEASVNQQIGTADAQTLGNKITVAEYFDTQAAMAGVNASSSLPFYYSYNNELHGVLLGVTNNSASVTAGEASITAWLAGLVTSGGNYPLSGATIPATSSAHYTGTTLANATPLSLINFLGGSNVFVDSVVVSHSQAIGDIVSVTFNNTGNGIQLLSSLASAGDTVVNVASNGSGAGLNVLSQINETDNNLAKVIITGSNPFYFGESTADSNGAGASHNDAVITGSGITGAAVPTTSVSSLQLIDASATTGGVTIYAGASNVAGTTYFNGTALAANSTITYTGLTIKGGSGQDSIKNDANNGVVIDGNHSNDFIALGGSGASASFGSGSSDLAWVGVQYSGVNGLIGTQQLAGSAVGDTVTFGAGASATIVIGVGAEAGNTAGTNNIGQTTLNGAAAGLKLNFSQVVSTSSAVNENAFAGQPTLLAAENAAAHALGGTGLVYFNYGGNEFIIAVTGAEAGISATDAIVELVGITNHSMTAANGIVTLG